MDVVQNLFKNNNKNTKSTSVCVVLMSLLLTLNVFDTEFGIKPTFLWLWTCIFLLEMLLAIHDLL